MSKTWKWILGILLVLALVGALFAIGFMWQTRMGIGQGWNTPFDRDWNHPMMGQRGNWQHPMMGGRGFIPFGGFFLLGGLVKLILFFGLIYGAYWLGRRNARITLDPAPAARVDASAAPVANPVPAPRKVAKKIE